MKQQLRTKNQIIEGVIWKQLLFFFFPILLGTFFQQFYNTIDSVIVGRFVGKEALASVGGSAGQIVNLVVGFFTGLTAGAGVIISQFYGARDSKGLNDSIHTAYAFSLAGSILFMIAGLSFSPHILELMNTPKELMADSRLYLQIYFAGILFTFIYNMGSGILRALGNSRRPLYYLIICSLLNIILDLIMVRLFHMGVAGVALATLLAQAVSAVLVTRALMHSTDIYQLKLRNIRFHGRVLKSQLYVGLPGGFQTTMYSLSNLIIQAAINVYGTDTTASWAAYGKLDAIFWMVSGAFGVSITTFVGQNYGAGRYDRIQKKRPYLPWHGLCNFRLLKQLPDCVPLSAFCHLHQRYGGRPHRRRYAQSDYTVLCDFYIYRSAVGRPSGSQRCRDTDADDTFRCMPAAYRVDFFHRADESFYPYGHHQLPGDLDHNFHLVHSVLPI